MMKIQDKATGPILNHNSLKPVNRSLANFVCAFSEVNGETALCVLYNLQCNISHLFIPSFSNIHSQYSK